MYSEDTYPAVPTKVASHVMQHAVVDIDDPIACYYQERLEWRALRHSPGNVGGVHRVELHLWVLYKYLLGMHPHNYKTEHVQGGA